MGRHRDLAASPVRTAAETWDVLTDLVVATLDRSPEIDAGSVRASLDAAATVGRALAAAGHLDRTPLTVDAPPLRLTIGTVTGDGAFRALEDENLNAVPGAATADTWTVFLPRPTGLSALIDEVIEGIANISTDAPPAEKTAASESASAPIDLRRLDPTMRS